MTKWVWIWQMKEKKQLCVVCYWIDFDQQFDLSFKEDQMLPEIKINASGAVGGKTAVLPAFCKIERGGGSGGMAPRQIMVVLPRPCAGTHSASSATQQHRI